MTKRKLGFWETGATLLHDTAEGASIIFSKARVKGKVDKALLLEALMLMHQKHPLLRATIKNGFFEINEGLEGIELEEIQAAHDDDWKAFSEKQMNTLFETDKLLWRSYILHHNEHADLVFVFHHAICDGFACVNFVDELLRFYTKLEISVPFDELPLQLLPPVEELLPSHSSQLILPEYSTTKIPFANFEPLGKRVTKSHIQIVEPQLLKKLKEGCHRKKIHVNAFLYSSLIHAQAELFGKSFNPLVKTPINLRSFCKPPLDGDYVGCFLSYITHPFNGVSNQENIWEFASHYHKNLLDLIPKYGFLPTEFTESQVRKRFALDEIESRKAFPSALCITDKGRFEFPDIYGSLRLEAFYVTSSRQAADLMVNLSVTSVLDKMFLCFSYPHPLVSEKYIKELSKIFMNALKKELRD